MTNDATHIDRFYPTPTQAARELVAYIAESPLFTRSQFKDACNTGLSTLVNVMTSFAHTPLSHATQCGPTAALDNT